MNLRFQLANALLLGSQRLPLSGLPHLFGIYLSNRQAAERETVLRRGIGKRKGNGGRHFPFSYGTSCSAMLPHRITLQKQGVIYRLVEKILG